MYYHQQQFYAHTVRRAQNLENFNEALFLSPCHEGPIVSMGGNPNAFHKVRTKLRSTVNSKITANASNYRKH